MVRENPTWGPARIADELFLKLGIQVSPRTLPAYWPSPRLPTRPRLASQSGHTFIRHHAPAVVACDCLVAITARFRVLYGWRLSEIGSRRIIPGSVDRASHRGLEAATVSRSYSQHHEYGFLLPDGDSIFSAQVDEPWQAFGLKILRPLR